MKKRFSVKLFCVTFWLCMTFVCGYAAQQKFVPASTNIGGWSVTLFAITNHFSAGDPIKLTLTVSNTTSRAGNSVGFISDWTTGLAAPDFGRYVITNLSNSTEVGPKPRETKMIMGSSSGGDVSPHDFVNFPLELTKHYVIEAPTSYVIYFKGKLPSIVSPEEQIEFETPPLILTIKSQTSQTNASPQILNH